MGLPAALSLGCWAMPAAPSNDTCCVANQQALLSCGVKSSCWERGRVDTGDHPGADLGLPALPELKLVPHGPSAHPVRQPKITR